MPKPQVPTDVISKAEVMRECSRYLEQLRGRKDERGDGAFVAITRLARTISKLEQVSPYPHVPESRLQEAVEQFRQRAIEAVQAKGEEYREQAERWHNQAEQETGVFQELSYADRNSCLSKAEAAFAYADLLRTLPVKEEENG